MHEQRKKRVHHAVILGVVSAFVAHEILPLYEHWIVLAVNLTWLMEDYV